MSHRTVSHRAVTISGFVVALAVAGAPLAAMARHRHHQPPPQQGAAASQAAPGGRISPNPRAASMRQSEDALRKAMTSDPVASAARTPGALRDPKTRAQVSAALAVATLPRPELAGSRHRDGGHGWVGPVFWPFATFDLFDAALWGDGADAALWGYGGADLVTGLFGPYPDDDVTAYARYLPSATTAAPQPSMLARMCGEVKSGDIAGVPVEALRDSLSLDDGQRSALDDLARALTDGARLIAAACPETLPLSAQQRVGVMGQRLDAMIAAADAVAPPLSALFDRLSDVQKAQFAALGAPAAAMPASSAPAAAAPQPAAA
ncbi:MAG: Spy/CpxP family protein refolding chaperone, partial [Xanthobacteraceae bacterium]|nr:Spy/CpxP family protein refolding chaperone [Xanthobacteraceae bacterium]